MNACHTALELLRAGDHEGALRLLEDTCSSPELDAYYAGEARALHTCDDLEIDDQPCFSEAEDGCWVSAWVWVPAPEAEEVQS